MRPKPRSAMPSITAFTSSIGVTMFCVTPSRIFCPVEFLKGPAWRSAVVVDQNIGGRAGGQKFLLTRRLGYVADDLGHAHAEPVADFLRRLGQCPGIPAVDDEIAAGLRQCERATAAEASARGADDRLLSFQTKIHGMLLQKLHRPVTQLA